MEEQLQLEETQRTNQQSQDQIPYDPNAALKNPDGYTQVPDVLAQTPVEEVDPINVGQVEVTNPQLENASSNEVFGGSGDIPVLEGNDVDNVRALKSIPLSQVNNDLLDTLPDGNTTTNGIVSDDSDTVEEVLDPPTDPPTDPPKDPEDPEEPEDPDPEDPDPEDPDPEDPDPEDPDPEDPDPEDPDPEDPDPEDPDPEDPDPEDPGKGNPGNDKEVGNSPWDGETGASNNPGKGNHQDGQDPETNQPPGDSKNDGGQNNHPKNDNGDGGSGGNDSDKGGNNGFGNGDQDAPGNSGPNNNAENDQTPIGDYVDRFVSENPGDHWYEDIPSFDDNVNFDDPQISSPIIDFHSSDYLDDFGAVDFFE
jgi:hypothetical protein